MSKDFIIPNNAEISDTQQQLVKKNLEIQKLNNELKQVNKELEQFTYVASHDLQEPLRMITGFMELLKSRYGSQLDAKANTFIDFALNGGKRMQEMIVSLLELSRTSRQSGSKENHEMLGIINEVKQNVSRLIEDSGCIITIDANLPALPVFRSDILRLFQNLLINAIKFRKKEHLPVIEINAVEKAEEWLFIMRDNGLGIDMENQEKIFEVFGRAHTEQGYEGHGIGLAVCKKIVEYHGGLIWVESEPGAGSTFYFTLRK